MASVPAVLKVGKTFRFFVNMAVVEAEVTEIEDQSGWVCVSEKKEGVFWLNLEMVSGVQTLDEAHKAKASSN